MQRHLEFSLSFRIQCRIENLWSKKTSTQLVRSFTTEIKQNYKKKRHLKFKRVKTEHIPFQNDEFSILMSEEERRKLGCLLNMGVWRRLLNNKKYKIYIEQITGSTKNTVESTTNHNTRFPILTKEQKRFVTRLIIYGTETPTK